MVGMLGRCCCGGDPNDPDPCAENLLLSLGPGYWRGFDDTNMSTTAGLGEPLGIPPHRCSIHTLAFTHNKPGRTLETSFVFAGTYPPPNPWGGPGNNNGLIARLLWLTAGQHVGIYFTTSVLRPNANTYFMYQRAIIHTGPNFGGTLLLNVNYLQQIFPPPMPAWPHPLPNGTWSIRHNLDSGMWAFTLPSYGTFNWMSSVYPMSDACAGWQAQAGAMTTSWGLGTLTIEDWMTVANDP